MGGLTFLGDFGFSVDVCHWLLLIQNRFLEDMKYGSAPVQCLAVENFAKLGSK